MPLSIGTCLGVYEIRGSLGAGGMGEVYRARDTRLGRDVALKILPAAFSADPDRITRFKREARLLASLNHPRIGAIYGIEDAGTRGVRRLLQRCLEKDPRRRLRDIGDVRHWMDDHSGDGGVRRAAPSLWRSFGWLLGGVVLASGAFAGWLLWASPAQTPARNVQLQRLTELVGMEESPAISPDGKTVAFVARVGSRRQISFGCWREARLCLSPVTMSTTRSFVGRRIRVSSSILCRRPPPGSTARSGRSPPSAASHGGSDRRSAVVTSVW